MYKSLIIIAFVSLSFSVFSQAKHPAEISQDSLYNTMFHNGMKYEDYTTAITALQALHALHPDNIGYVDSLCLIYSETRNYAQCILTGAEVLKAMPDNLPVIIALAGSNQQIGRYPEALELYKKVFAKNSSIYANYQIAVLQYALKKSGEAQATLDRLLLNPAGLKEKISFATSSNSSQMVLFKAAAENLMGVIYQDMKDNTKAIECFKKALEIQPDFVLAQKNLDYMTKPDNAPAGGGKQ